MKTITLNCRNGDKLNVKQIHKEKPDIIFFVHWREKIPKEIHSKYICIGFHMTNLPYGRGGSPLQNLILAGKKETVISAFRITDEMDAGPVYLKEPLILSGTAQEIYDRAYEKIQQMIWKIKQDLPIPKKQKGKVIKFKRRTPEQSNIEHVKFGKVYDFIRMLDADDYPKAFLKAREFKISFYGVQKNGEELVSKCKISLQ